MTEEQDTNGPSSSQLQPTPSSSRTPLPRPPPIAFAPPPRRLRRPQAAASISFSASPLSRPALRASDSSSSRRSSSASSASSSGEEDDVFDDRHVVPVSYPRRYSTHYGLGSTGTQPSTPTTPRTPLTPFTPGFRRSGSFADVKGKTRALNQEQTQQSQAGAQQTEQEAASTTDDRIDSPDSSSGEEGDVFDDRHVLPVSYSRRYSTQPPTPTTPMTPITPMSPGFRLFGSNGSGKGKARAESQAVVDQQQTEKGQAMVVEQTLQVQSMVEQEPIQESAPQVEDSQSIKTAAPSDSEKNELSRTSSIASSIQSISASVADYVRSSLSSVASSRSSDGSTSTDQQQGPYTQSTYTRVRLRRQEASAPTQVVEADPFADPLNAPEPATVPSSSPDKIKPINDADKGDVEKDHLRTDKPAFDGSLFPDYAPLVQSRVTVGRWGLILAIGSFNLALVILFLFLAPTGASLVVMVALKARDILSVLWQTLLFLLALVSQPFLTKKPMVVHPPRKIVSLVPVYKESTQDVLDTVDSIINDNPVRTQDFNIIAILADGFDVEDDVIVTDTIARVDDFPYFSWKIRESAFRLHFGYRRGCPIMIVRKVKNAGKKDSLIFAFDLFNSDNEATGHCNSEAREMVLEHIRRLYDQPELEWFHFVFCTDADTKILAGSVNVLADRLMDEGPETVGACGIVEADFEKPGRSLRTCGLWYFWDHFQGFQYTYGQWIRRRSESSWGRVTCMPGAITMLRTGTILGQASAEYRKHVQNGNLVKRQVQYQGTDRRLCWSIISRSKSVRTVLETRAACFTIPPQSLSHYLSQRRRWGSNAYFNAFITLTGPNQHLVTRAWMTLELARSSLVFFRMYNFGHFVYNLVTKFSLIGVAPLLAITLLPQIWFFFCVVLPTKRYRGLWHHLLYGAVLNRACSVVLTPTVYANVLLGFGDFRWGKSHTGANAATQQPAGDDKAVDAMEKGESRPETPPKEYSEVC